MTSRTLHGPGELIAVMPAILGFQPQESVVVVALSAIGEIDLTMRVDRADLLLPEVADQAAATIASQLRRVAARRVIVLSFTDSDVSVSCDAVDAVMAAIEPVVDQATAWTSNGRTYRAPGCADIQCCPPEGSPLPLCALPSTATPRMGPSPAGSAGARQPERERRRAARAGDRWWSRREQDLQRWRSDALTRLTESMGQGADALELGRAAVCLRDVRVRDALIVTWLGGTAQAVVDVLDGRSTAEVAAALDGALRDADRPPPAVADVEAALDWLRRMLALARRRDTAAIHALIAVMTWYDGALDEARVAAREALACDDGYSLAGLIEDVCLAGLEPAWMRR